MGVELPLRVVVTILECCVTFFGVKLSISSFVLLLLLSEREYHEVVKNSSVTAVTSVSLYLLVFHFSL